MIANPYKNQAQPTKEITFDIGADDRAYILGTVGARRGFLDGLFSTMASKFIAIVREEMPLPESTAGYAENEKLMMALLSRLNFKI